MKRVLFILSSILWVRPSFAQIAYVASGAAGHNNSTAFFTFSYTVNASTTYLVLALLGDPTDDCNTASVSWNGVSLTLINTQKGQPSDSLCSLSMYQIVNPTTGTHDFTYSSVSPRQWAAVVSEYSGVGNAQPDNSGVDRSVNSNDSSLTSSLTTMTDNSWVVEMEGAYGGNNPATAGAGLTLRVCDAIFGDPCILDSNGPIHPAGPYSMTVNAPAGSNQYIPVINASFSPAGGGGADSSGLLLLGVRK